MKTNAKYAIIGLLYFTQSIPIAFMGTALLTIMRSEGIGLDKIGYLSLVMIPYALSFLWAPLVDRFGSSYFKWVSTASILYALFLFPASFLYVDNLYGLLILFTLAIFCMSVQDIAMDAFAITSLTDKEKSIGNGLQAGGGYFGLLIGGGGVLLVYDRLGWDATITLLTVVTLIPVIATIRYNKYSKKPDTRSDVSIRQMLEYFKDAKFKKWIPLLLLLKIPANVAFYFSNPQLIDKGLGLAEVGYIFGIWGMGAAVASGLVAGLVFKRAEIRTKLIIAIVANIIAIASAFLLSFVSSSQTTIIIFLCLAMGSMLGLTGMILNDVAMRHVRSGVEATDYSLQNFLSSLFYNPIIFVSGYIAQNFGYPTLFVCIAGIILVQLVFMSTYKSIKPNEWEDVV